MATGYTLLRQDEDIRKSDAYVDTVAPTEAAFETNPADIEDDLNNVRSMLSYLLDVQVGNWYDEIPTPSTFENGAKRGVANVNQDLHDLERKRVLRSVSELDDVTVPAAAKATGALDLTGGDFTNGETFTVGTRTYTMESVFSDTADYILIEAAATDTIDNIIAALTNGAGEGTKYGTGTVVNADITAAAGAGDTMDAEALVAGTAGNLIATTVSATNPVWGAATLSGGTGDMVILTLGEIPTQDTAAIGAVTTLGTVVAYNSDFGAATLDEVPGSSDISPKNMYEIVDHITRDPILDGGGKRIWALGQSESNTDGSTMTGTTPNRMQLTFVVIDDVTHALEVVDGTAIAGEVIHYSSVERVGMEDLNEQDFLRGAIVDFPAGTTVTLQVAYNNQGTAPVDQVTSTTHDLEGPGLYEEWRDDLEATLVKILEGSAGGTSEVQFGAAVDIFNNDAIDNDFAHGASFDTTGTPIQIAETAGLIERASDLTVYASGAGELLLHDSNINGEATWAQAGVKLTETQAEVAAYEVAFGGEVSLFNALVQAMNNAQDPVRTWHAVTVTTAKDLNVSLADGNVDTAFPDLSSGTFTDNHWLYLNGRMMRPGADIVADFDYYPGTALTPAAQLKFERVVRVGDIISVVVWPNA